MAEDESACCLCGEPARHDGTATLYAVRFEGSARVTTFKRAAVVLCDPCAERVRAHWRTRRLVGVGALVGIFGSLGAGVVAMDALAHGPLQVVLFVVLLGVVLVSCLGGTVWLRERRRELHDVVAERYDLEEVFDQLERAGGEAAGVSFELQLGRAADAPRLEALASPRRRGRSR